MVGALDRCGRLISASFFGSRVSDDNRDRNSNVGCFALSVKIDIADFADAFGSIPVGVFETARVIVGLIYWDRDGGGDSGDGQSSTSGGSGSSNAS